MSEEYVRLPKSDWLEILDAMRAKEGSSELIVSGELAEKIRAITTGIVPSGTKTITNNGTHDVTQYAEAKVDVPIPSGYIKPSGTKNITANGSDIDVNSYKSVNVNVPIPDGYIKPTGTITINNNTDSSGIDISTYRTAVVRVPVPEGYEMCSVSVTAEYVISDEDGGPGVMFRASDDDVIAKHAGEYPDFMMIFQKIASFDTGYGGITSAVFAWIYDTMYTTSLYGADDGGNARGYDSTEDDDYWKSFTGADYFCVFSTATAEQRQFVGDYLAMLLYKI